MLPDDMRLPILEGGRRGGDDITIPIDPEGLVLYYTIGPWRYLLNGHTGVHSEVISDLDAAVYEALSVADPRRHWQALIERWGSRVEGRIREVERLRDGSDPRMVPAERQQSFVVDRRPREFTVYVAQACNLACQYCFNSRGTFGGPAALMTASAATEVLAFISKEARAGLYPTIKVDLFGGEPLLAPEATRILARGLQDLNHEGLATQIHILLFTNGTIYHKEIFDILAERSDLCTVMVSIDGERETHDKNRPFASDGRGSSYDLVLGNLKRMAAEGIPHSAVCVVPEPFDFVAASEALHALGISRLELKEPLQHVFGRESPEAVSYSNFARWRRNYLAYCDYYLDHLDEPGWVEHTDRIALASTYQWMMEASGRQRIGLACRLAELKVGISPRGEIMPCISFLKHGDFRLGDVRSGFDVERYASFQEWLLANGQHRIDHPRCRNCFAKLACNGGCYAESLDRSGRLEPRARAGCDYTQERVKLDLHFLASMRRRHPALLARLRGD